MTLKIKILTLLFLAVTTSLFSQENWSLDACVSYAITHNLDLNNSRYTKDSSKENYRQSIRNLLPSVNGNASYNLRFGRSVNPDTGGYTNTDFFINNYSLNSSLSLFQGFQKLNTIAATKLIYKATKEEVLQQKYLLAFRIMSAYYDIRFFEGLLQISKEQETISQANYDLVQRQIELGMKAGADLYEAEAVLLTDKLAVTQSSNQLAASKLNLIQEMNLEGATTITLEIALTEATDSNSISEVHTDTIFNKATSFIPILKAQELRAKAARKGVAIARGALYPSLSFSAGYGTGYFETNTDDTGSIIPFETQLKDNASRYIGVSLSIPISNKWSGRSNVKQRKIALLQAKNQVNVQKQELYQLIQQLVQDYKSLQIEFEQSKQRMKAQNLTFKIAQKKHEKGLISALDLYQSKNLAANAQNENLQVGLRLKVKSKTLDFYKGLPIFNSIP